MSKVRLAGASLLALGIVMILFEALVWDSRASIQLCTPPLVCEYTGPPLEYYNGLFPTIAGVIILGFYRTDQRKQPVEV